VKPKSISVKPREKPPEKISHDTDDLYRLLVDRVLDYAIFALDPDGHILTWNEGARRLKGYTAAEIIGKHFSIFYSQTDLVAGKPERELMEAVEIGQVEDEGWRLRKDGTRFWANVLITAIRDNDGRLVGFAKVTRDLTERRAAEQQALEDAGRIAAEAAMRAAAEQRAQDLRVLADQLRTQAAELEKRGVEAEAANRMKSEFLAAMSHELRTPLNAIGGYAQLLQIGVGGPVTLDQRQHLDRIQRSQQHLLNIINDLLNFSRIEAGQIAYDIRPVPVHEVIDAVAQMVAPQAQTKHLRLKAPQCSPKLIVQADRPKVEQILLNLLSNAVKFTSEGGEIELECGPGDGVVWFNVRDSGIGIPSEQLDAIFEPFVQVGRSLASPKEGTGLGLAISRDLARAMNGDVTVASHEGVGSTFTVTLPRAKTEP